MKFACEGSFGKLTKRVFSLEKKDNDMSQLVTEVHESRWGIILVVLKFIRN